MRNPQNAANCSEINWHGYCSGVGSRNFATMETTNEQNNHDRR